MNWPPLAVGIITYNRPQSFTTSLAYLQMYLHYPNIVRWVFSDDGSDSDYLPSGENIVHLRHPRRGMGYNWNAMIAACEEVAPYTFCMQDDWCLMRDVDLRHGVALMEYAHNSPAYRMVRYHKLTGHIGLPMQIKEWDVSGILPEYNDGPNEYHPHMMNFLDLMAPATDIFSPYSGGAHLRHRDFTQWYGQYPEGQPFSETEMDFMRRVNNALRVNPEAAPRIAMLPEFIKSAFRDIDVSYRGTAVEKETLAQ